MTKSKARKIYEDDRTIRLAVGLLAAGISFDGGGFIRVDGELPDGIDFQTNPDELEKIAKDLIIDGRSNAEIIATLDKYDIMHLDAEEVDEGIDRVINLKYREASFLKDSPSPLERALINYDTQKELEKVTPQSPQAVQLLQHFRRAEASLGLPSFLLDQPSIDAASIETIYTALWHFPFDGSSIRHLIRYEIDNGLFTHFPDILDGANIAWDWNYHWGDRERACRFGAVYQVFRKFDLDLTKLWQHEQEALNLLVEVGLFPKSSLVECRESYGL